MKCSLLFVPFLALALSLNAQAQEVLQLEDAIQQALAFNYGIKVAKNNHQISQNNAHPGNAGLLPNVSLSAGANYNLNNVNVELAEQGENGQANFREVEVDGLATSSNNGSIGLNYTVFDGLGNVNTYRVLKTTVFQSEAQMRSTIELNLAQVIDAYYQVARLANTQRILEEQLQVSRLRLERAQNQAEFGAVNKLLVLNAEVDLNTDSASVATAALNLANARRTLNALMGVEIDRRYELPEAIDFVNDLQLEQLRALAMENNADLVSANYGKELAALNLNVAKAARMPTVSVNASYGFNNQDNGPVNFARRINSLGLAAGASLNFNIFNGNRTNINIQNAEVQVANSELQYENLKLQLERDLANALETYRNSLKILALEQKSLEAAELNFQRTQDAFELGQATGTQFREAQLNLLRVRNNLNELQYDTKLYEKDLLRLSGQLLK